VTGAEMEVLVNAPGQALFQILTLESSVADAVKWANQLERGEVGDCRLGEDWVLTYRMRASRSLPRSYDAAEEAIADLEADARRRIARGGTLKLRDEVAEEDARRKFDALRQQYLATASVRSKGADAT
jgi:hypothetical protein